MSASPAPVTPAEPTARPPRTTWNTMWPGLLLIALAVVVSLAIAGLIPGMSALTVAVVLGIVAGNVPGIPESTKPGVSWATKKLLRTGVVLLGLQLAVNQIYDLGAGVILAVVITVAVTFFGTLLLGRLLGASRGLSILVATGFSICGASAIAAMESVVDREDEDVATGVAMVTIFGTLSMLLLPLAATGLDLQPEELARVSGGAVHEVAQVVAAASPAGAAAVGLAVVIKLSRVVLLAPMVTAVSLVERRRSTAPDTGKRPPIIPLFVIGFLVAVGVRSFGVLPEAVLDIAKQTTTVLLAGALFGLGNAVRIPALIRTGRRACLLGASSTVLVTGVAFGAMTLLA